MRRANLALLAAWAAMSTATGSNFYQGVASNSVPWPGGIVPYLFTTNVSPAEQVVYLGGMKEWALSANIQFVPYTGQSKYVVLDLDYLQGTNSYYAGAPPVMTVDNLSRAQVCHETGHLLGFQHEHVRTDRDNFIVVNFQNIVGGASTNGSGEGAGSPAGLYLIDSNSTANGPYDFESVMHYGRTLFSIDPETLDVLDPQPPYVGKYYNRIGNFALSVGDRAGAAALYGPPAIPLTNIVSTTADGGPGSLRAAIYYANDHPGTTVRFNIPATDSGFSNGVYTIYVSGQLPPLVSDGTVIDATTQPGYPGRPIVALDGSQTIPQIEFSIGGIYVYAANCAVRGLAIDNFTNSAVNLLYNYAASNHVEACYIGLAPDGATPAPNDYEGINISAGASANVIGGSSAGQRNVISGNSGYGITITGTNSNGNVVSGNYIGLDGSGALAVSNTYNGIGIWGGSCRNVIGGPGAGAGNVISGNVAYGIYIGDSNTIGTVVQGNYIGINAGGTGAVANSGSGLAVVAGSAGNSILNNVVSGNASYGLFISDPGTSNNLIQGNFIGTDAAGMNALPNGYMGLGIWSGAWDNLVGGTNAAARNVISGNAQNGMGMGGPAGGGNVIEGNYIGVAGDGRSALPNDGVGVYVEISLQNNFIGSNVISANTYGGISFYQATNNIVQGNYIGLAADGATPAPNGGAGIYLFESQSNLLGGVAPGQGNVVSANLDDGIQMYGPGTSYNIVEGNLVGTTKTGLSRLGNLFSALSLIAGPTNNTIGGANAAARNIFSGSSNYDGVYLDGASNNVVQGNYIGTDASGLIALTNGEYGLTLFGASQSNLILGNVIAASANYGVIISDPGTSGNIFQGNDIGVGADGATPLGNAWQGLVLQNGAATNIIGLALDGSGAGNIIADNGYEGVILYDTNTVGNCLRGNSIYGNGAIGINLVGGSENGYGVTANHVGGAVPGPNDLQNYPVLTAAAVFTNSMVIAGTINSGPGRIYLIDIYRNPAPDPSGFGQGQTYVGSTIAQMDMQGNGSFSRPLAARLAGQYFTATATDAATGDTSEFSLDLQAANVSGTGLGELTNPSYSVSNGFSFGITLATNQYYTVQLTTNLAASPVMWADLTNFLATNPSVQILDGAATNSPARFYRIVTP
jgi:parallel beta-helix repeat protein